MPALSGSVGHMVAPPLHDGRRLRDALMQLPHGRIATLLADWAVQDGALRSLIDAELARVPAAEDEPAIIGESAVMRAVFDRIARYAATNSPVLITGESGTGKELAARALHDRSTRKRGPFVAINCAALPPSLIAAELFGHERGAFTGAVQRRAGQIERAHGGTLFLDEIGDLPIETQGHLLRFLQDMTITRVGGSQEIPIDARIVSATNVPLGEAISQRRFREDLFYRLNVLELALPPLRARGADIELIARHALRRFATETGCTARGFTNDALDALLQYRWPGNARQLLSVVRRAMVMAPGPLITRGDLDLGPAPSAAADEATRLAEALDAESGCVTAAARRLNVSRVTVYRMMKRHGMSRDARHAV